MCIFLHHFSGRYDRKKGVSELPNFSNQFFLSRVEKESSQPTLMSDNLNAGSLMMNIKEALGPLVVDVISWKLNFNFNHNYLIITKKMALLQLQHFHSFH
jgi:hypothetical protein